MASSVNDLAADQNIAAAYVAVSRSAGHGIGSASTVELVITAAAT